MKPGYKQTEVGAIPEEWDAKRLRDVAQIRTGIAKNENVPVADPILVHYLRVANVQDGFLDLSEMSRLEISRSDLPRFSVLPGDVLMNEGGDLAAHETQRVALYQCTAALVRAYANIAGELSEAGYTAARVDQIKRDVDGYVKLREVIRAASGETIDLKAYEADMRHLIDTYIEAREPRTISNFGEIGLIDLIVKSGIAAAIASLPDGIRASQNAIAETIANNVRSRIIKEQISNPAYYDKMSALLQEILADLKARRIDYEEFLKRMGALAQSVQTGTAETTPEPLRKSPGLRAIYDNLRPPDTAAGSGGTNEGSGEADRTKLTLAESIHETIRKVRPADWRGIKARENVIKAALMPLLGGDTEEVERLFKIVEAQKEY